MLVMYYPPFRAENDVEISDQSLLWLRACVEDLLEFPRHILDDAWRHVRRSHKVERWPTMQVIRDACIALSSPPPAPHPRQSTQSEREADFHRTGMWLDAWGDRPETQTQKLARHDRVMATMYADNPHLAGQFDVTLARLRNGESASQILREVMGGHVNEMPLLPAERMGSATAERVRQQSLRRNEDAA